MSSNKKTILVVDDEPSILSLLGHAFSRDYNVKLARDGEAAIEIAFQHHNDIDLVWLDYVMPGMDGFEVCKRLKSDTRTAHIPIIISSGACEEIRHVEPEEIGCCAFLDKPIELDGAKELIKKCLQK